jgi:hypothetical protein
MQRAMMRMMNLRISSLPMIDAYLKHTTESYANPSGHSRERPTAWGSTSGPRALVGRGFSFLSAADDTIARSQGASFAE